MTMSPATVPKRLCLAHGVSRDRVLPGSSRRQFWKVDNVSPTPTPEVWSRAHCSSVWFCQVVSGLGLGSFYCRGVMPVFSSTNK